MRKKRLKKQGKCPIVEILLISRFHDKDCPCGLGNTSTQLKDFDKRVG